MADISRTLARAAPHNGTACGGRPIRVERGKATVRNLLRRHIREEGRRLQGLAEPWQCTRSTVYGAFCNGHPFSPQHIEAAIAWLGLDEFDANELRIRGAREAGWSIDLNFVMEGER